MVQNEEHWKGDVTLCSYAIKKKKKNWSQLVLTVRIIPSERVSLREGQYQVLYRPSTKVAQEAIFLSLYCNRKCLWPFIFQNQRESLKEL